LFGVCAAVGWPLLTLYVSSVVPAHGTSEVAAFWQLGSSTLLEAVGVQHKIVLVFSAGIFLVTTALGLAAGVRLRRRFGSDAWLPACAAAFALLGSPFVHTLDVGFAVPLAVMLYAASRRTVTAVAVLLIIVPWQYLVQDTGVATAIEIPLLLVVLDALTEGRMFLTAALVSVIVLCGTAAYRATDAADLQLEAVQKLPAHEQLPENALAEVRWAAFSRQTKSVVASIYSRTPTEIAIVVLMLTTAFLSCGPTKCAKTET
jgi:hypothetical protein